MPFATCTTHKYLWASVCFGGRIEWGTPNLTLPMCQWVSSTLTHTRHVPLNVYCIEMTNRIRGESKATTNLKESQDTISHLCQRTTSNHCITHCITTSNVLASRQQSPSHYLNITLHHSNKQTKQNEEQPMTSLQWVESPVITLPISYHWGAWVESPTNTPPVSYHLSRQNVTSHHSASQLPLRCVESLAIISPVSYHWDANDTSEHER